MLFGDSILNLIFKDKKCYCFTPLLPIFCVQYIKIINNSLIKLIRNILFSFKDKGCLKTILFGIAGHTDISGHKTAEFLAKITALIQLPFKNFIPWSDYCPKLKFCVHYLWSNFYNNLLFHFITWYRTLNPTILSKPGFHKLNLSYKAISLFFRLRYGDWPHPPPFTFFLIILKRLASL